MMRTQIKHLDDFKKNYFSVFQALITSPIFQFDVNTLENFVLICFMRFL